MINYSLVRNTEFFVYLFHESVLLRYRVKELPNKIYSSLLQALSALKSELFSWDYRILSHADKILHTSFIWNVWRKLILISLLNNRLWYWFPEILWICFEKHCFQREDYYGFLKLSPMPNHRKGNVVNEMCRIYLSEDMVMAEMCPWTEIGGLHSYSQLQQGRALWHLEMFFNFLELQCLLIWKHDQTLDFWFEAYFLSSFTTRTFYFYLRFLDFIPVLMILSTLPQEC
jgi:hypothetical protein